MLSIERQVDDSHATFTQAAKDLEARMRRRCASPVVRRLFGLVAGLLVDQRASPLCGKRERQPAVEPRRPRFRALVLARAVRRKARKIVTRSGRLHDRACFGEKSGIAVARLYERGLAFGGRGGLQRGIDRRPDAFPALRRHEVGILMQPQSYGTQEEEVRGAADMPAHWIRMRRRCPAGRPRTRISGSPATPL